MFINHKPSPTIYPKQSGIAQLLVLLLVLGGVVVGSALVQQRTNLSPKASENNFKQIKQEKNKEASKLGETENKSNKGSKSGLVKLEPLKYSVTPNAFGQAKVKSIELGDKTNVKLKVDAEVKNLNPQIIYLLGVCLTDGSNCTSNTQKEMKPNPAGSGIFKSVELSTSDINRTYAYKIVVIEKTPSATTTFSPKPVPSSPCTFTKPCLEGKYVFNFKDKQKDKKDKDECKNDKDCKKGSTCQTIIGDSQGCFDNDPNTPCQSQSISRCLPILPIFPSPSPQ